MGERSKDLVFYDAHVTWLPAERPAAWGSVFQALAALEEMNRVRRREDRLVITIWAQPEYGRATEPAGDKPPSWDEDPTGLFQDD
jgi:hypothetical protein